MENACTITLRGGAYTVIHQPPHDLRILRGAAPWPAADAPWPELVGAMAERIAALESTIQAVVDGSPAAHGQRAVNGMRDFEFEKVYQVAGWERALRRVLEQQP